MNTKRQSQLEAMIKRNFSLVLQQEGSAIYGNEPLVTVTNVAVSPDLSIAKIYLSVFNMEDKQALIDVMENAQVKAKLRYVLGQRLRNNIRKIPQLHFFLDDTLDEMEKLNKLFDGL